MQMDEMLLYIGKRVKKERIKRGLTQDVLAVRLDPLKSKGYISKLERGKAGNPTLQTLLSVANSLDVEIWDLLTPEGMNEENDQAIYPPSLLSIIKDSSLKLTDREKKLLKGIKINGQVPDNEEIYMFFLALFRSIDWYKFKRYL